MDLLDFNDYGPMKNKDYAYVSALIDSLSKVGWTIPLKKTQTIKFWLEDY